MENEWLEQGPWEEEDLLNDNGAQRGATTTQSLSHDKPSPTVDGVVGGGAAEIDQPICESHSDGVTSSHLNRTRV